MAFKALLFSALSSALGVAWCEASPARPAYLDFSAVPPPRAGEFFELDLQGTALTVATMVLTADEKELTKSLERARIRVVDLDASNRVPVSQRMRKAVAALNAAGWKKNETPATPKSQSVLVYSHGAGQGHFDALAVLIWDRGEQAVVGFATGEFSAREVKAISARIKIDEIRERFAP